MLRNPGGSGGAAFDPSALEAAIATLQSDSITSFQASGVALSTNASPTLVGTVPAGKRFLCLGLAISIDDTTGTFTPGGSEITILAGIGSGNSNLYFGFFNNASPNEGTAKIYGGSFVAGGVTVADAGAGLYIQFNNAGITGGGTAVGTVVLFGVLIDTL